MEIVGEVGNDHFCDFIREWGGRFVRGTGLWWRITEEPIDLGFGSVPHGHHANREVRSYDANGSQVSQFMNTSGKASLGIRDVGIPG